MRSWLLVLVAVGLVWFWNAPVLLPLKLVVVLFHELGHAAMAVATGGEVVALQVGADESGVVHSLGGWPVLVLNAGYLGSAAFGLALVATTRTPARARTAAGALAVLLAVVAVWWVRPVVSFGFGWVLVSAAAFALLARTAPPAVAAAALRVLGVFSVLYALGDVVDDVLLRPGAPSDARFLAERTGVPALVWGLGWSGVSVAALGWGLPRVA